MGTHNTTEEKKMNTMKKINNLLRIKDEVLDTFNNYDEYELRMKVHNEYVESCLTYDEMEIYLTLFEQRLWKKMEEVQ
jgi:hypothetical protein